MVGYTILPARIIIHEAEIEPATRRTLRQIPKKIKARRVRSRLAFILVLRYGFSGLRVNDGAIGVEKGGLIESENGREAGCVDLCLHCPALYCVAHAVEEEVLSEKLEEIAFYILGNVGLEVEKI